MGPESAPTEMFRDLWLPPVETRELLPAVPGPEAMCFVITERRVYVVQDGAWTPATPKVPEKDR
jgi:hypothetical protein